MSNLTKTIKTSYIRYSWTGNIVSSNDWTIPLSLQLRISIYLWSSIDLAYQNLNKELYSNLRHLFGLKSQLAQSSIKTTIAKYKTVKQQLFQNPYRYKDENNDWQRIPKTLEWLWKPIFFSRPQADLVRNRDYSFVNDGQTLSINTLDWRTKCPFESKHFAEYH